MSVRVQNAVWERSRARGNDRLVLIAIADHAHDDGSGAWPSHERLGQKTLLSRRTIQRCIASLCALGELEVVSGRGRGHSNRYRVLLVDAVVEPGQGAGDADAPSAGKGVNLTHPPGKGVKLTGKGATAGALTIRNQYTHPTPARASEDLRTSPGRLGASDRRHVVKKDQDAIGKHHQGCHPQVCRHRDSLVAKCIPEALVHEFCDSLYLAGMSPALIEADVVAWARKDRPPEGFIADGDAYRYWRRRWSTTRSSRAPRPTKVRSRGPIPSNVQHDTTTHPTALNPSRRGSRLGVWLSDVKPHP